MRLSQTSKTVACATESSAQTARSTRLNRPVWLPADPPSERKKWSAAPGSPKGPMATRSTPFQSHASNRSSEITRSCGACGAIWRKKRFNRCCRVLFVSGRFNSNTVGFTASFPVVHSSCRAHRHRTCCVFSASSQRP